MDPSTEPLEPLEPLGLVPDPRALPKRYERSVRVPPFLSGRVYVPLFMVGLAFTVLGFVVAGPFGLAPLFGAFGLALLLNFVPAKFIVGVDGIAVVWLKIRYFVPYGSLDTTERTAEGIVLHGHGGRTLELHTDEPQSLLYLVETRRTFAATVPALLAHEALEGEAAMLVPSGKENASDWTERVRKLGTEASYREMSLPRDRLLAILAMPSLPMEMRAAAAFALGAPTSSEEAAIVDLAIGATASQVFARALTAAKNTPPNTSDAYEAREAREALVRVHRAALREARDKSRG